MSVQLPGDLGADQPDLREVAALTEPLFVFEDHPDAPLDSEAVVYSEAREYLINVDVGFCECPDNHYRQVRCKHLLRYDYVTGSKEIPAWVDLEDVDDQLRRRLEAYR